MTSSEFQLCRKVGSVFHCPHMNLLNKNLETLCLYNLYSQDPVQIEKTCRVDISLLQTHVVQVSTSLYRIIAADPIQLVIDCITGSNITTIQGVYMLQLTADCPKASTPEHLFVWTPELLLGSQELITLPLLTQSKEWLGEVERELDLNYIVESTSMLPSPMSSMPLETFRDRLRTRKLNLYRKVEGYLIKAMAYISASVGFLLLVRLCASQGRKRFRKGKPKQIRVVETGFSDSDGGLIARPMVPLPPAVRRQFEVR